MDIVSEFFSNNWVVIVEVCVGIVLVQNPLWIPAVKKIQAKVDQSVLYLEGNDRDNFRIFSDLIEDNFIDIAEEFNENVEVERDFFHEIKALANL